MKNIFFAFIFLVAVFSTGSAQQNLPERRVIEVSGSAEQWVTPNEFTFKITILERVDKKDKITIEQQEASLKTELSRVGIDAVKDLSVYDLSSNYFPKKKIRDVLGSKDYRLKVRDISKIAPLTELVDRLNIAKLDLIDTEHSEMTRLRRETKIEAIKAAKDKAVYLLGAIGEKAGKPVYIKEIEEGSPRYISAGVMSNTVNVSNFRSTSSNDPVSDLSFTQIKIRYVIEAKFEIE